MKKALLDLYAGLYLGANENRVSLQQVVDMVAGMVEKQKERARFFEGKVVDSAKWMNMLGDNSGKK